MSLPGRMQRLECTRSVGVSPLRRSSALPHLFAAFVWLWCLGAGRPAGASDLDTMSSNTLNFLTGRSANPADSYMVNAMKSIQNTANSRLTAMAADGSWSDINYASVATTGGDIVEHYKRIRQMALAFRAAGQSLYGDARLTSACQKALKFAETYVYVGRSRPGNWWYWEIGLPNEFGPALFLLQGNIDATVFKTARDTYSYLIYGAPHMTGQNLIWSAKNHMYLALLDRDTARMELVRSAFETQCAIQPGEGIRPDGSFYQHGNQLYNGGYGAGFADDISSYLIGAANTPWQVSNSGLETFGNFFLDGSWWMIHEGAYELACRSREITRGNYGTRSCFLALLFLGSSPYSRREEAIAAAKYHLSLNGYYDQSRAALAQAIKASPVAPVRRTGHKHFYDTDFTVHSRPNYYISLKMFSNRVINAENTNSEGLKAWCYSDGVTWMLLDGTDYRMNDVLPTLDWQRLPGTTVERKSRSAGAGLGLGTRSFVGGATANGRGVSAMDFAAKNSSLTARKSWFFFDEEMVCLGTAIACPTGNPVETTVDQRRLVPTTAALTIDGVVQPATLPSTQSPTAASWIHCGNFGYYFPGGAALQVQRQDQQGAWRDLNVSQATTVKSNSILTILFNHGANPTSGTYAYAVLPKFTAAQTSAYSAAPPFSIAAQNATAHAVRHNGHNALGVVFWEKGTVEKITADTPCIVYAEQRLSTYTLAVSDPTHAARTIKLAIALPLEPRHLPANVTSVHSDSLTTVSVAVKNGENTLVSFGLKRPGSAVANSRWKGYD